MPSVPSSTPGAEPPSRSLDPQQGHFGPNAWLVEDLYERYLADPHSVAESWREFFSDYQRVQRPDTSQPTSAVGGPGDGAVPLRGASLLIANNMAASLSIPTATSVRTVPARLLEINRAMLNEYLSRTTGAKVSFTHVIAFAVLRGLAAVPALNATYVDAAATAGGTPGVVRHEHVGLGIAVDLEKSDGSRTLMVPVIRHADLLDFAAFILSYEDLVRRVHAGTAKADDLAGATVSITNPGTLGTVQSVPRLMPGQGVIVGVGALGWPAGFEAADPAALASLGVGKVVTLTSTYDHRIIQGAQSGLFLRHVEECLRGEHDFYDELFADLGVPYEPARWSHDQQAVGAADDHALREVRVQELINMYRVRGHLNAHLDPLDAEPPELHPELDIANYGLSIWDLGRTFLTDGLAGRDHATLQEILTILRDAYCRTIGIEYMHIQDPVQKRWVQARVEGVDTAVSVEEQHHLLERLNAAEVFERFLHTRYVGQKRFGLEGAESTIVALDALFDAAADAGVTDSVIGMAHRGRLNVLANVVGKSYSEIFSEFEGNLDPDSVQGSGDVKYHKGASGVFKSATGATLRLSMASNPSHLEAVDPVVEGMARAIQDRVIPPSAGESAVAPLPGHPVLAVLVHGDAAFAGQGVVAETLNLSGLSGYRTGGTVHLVINNQLGFTTSPQDARTSYYPTDVAKMIQAPIFHVNGDDPEACARVMRLAFEFREAFSSDVVVDLVCYRRHGHNEGDDPSYTQPLMYRAIDEKRSVRKLYTESLIRRGDLTMEEAERALEDFQERLQAVLDEVRERPIPVVQATRPAPVVPEDPPAPTTGVDAATLLAVAAATTTVPDGFTLHPKLARQFATRRQQVAEGQVDWALAEALAIGSLVLEGTDVRLVGQDTRRGTFSQRHAALIDFETGRPYVPLCHLDGAKGRFTVRDTLLSEYAAVGFEYGYSIERPDALVAWEAQFGDFVNGAEIIIDNFLVTAEDKWGQQAGLVLLLPHGNEGQGPEHSSGRIERFLTLCARNNLRVAYPSTAAQYFHLLRSQVRRGRTTPLVCFTPKSLLRAAVTRSGLDQLTSGRFETLLDVGNGDDPASVRSIVLAAGKVAHEAQARRDELVAAGSTGAASIAVVRVEQLYPWPDEALGQVLGRYVNATDVCWLQEEPENMGPWPFVHHQLHRALRPTHELRHVARAESASPATGSVQVHAAEQADLLERAIG